MNEVRVQSIEIDVIDTGSAAFDAAAPDDLGRSTHEIIRVAAVAPRHRATVVLEWRGYSPPPEIVTLINRAKTGR